jgi:hypothetical protein
LVFVGVFQAISFQIPVHGGLWHKPIGFADRCLKNGQCAQRIFGTNEPQNVLAPTNFREHVGVCRRLHI